MATAQSRPQKIDTSVARNGQIVAILSYEARRGILTTNATTRTTSGSLGFDRSWPLPDFEQV